MHVQELTDGLGLVYKIPYRRARAWPGRRVRARAKESCIQGWVAQGKNTRPSSRSVSVRGCGGINP